MHSTYNHSSQLQRESVLSMLKLLPTCVASLKVSALEESKSVAAESGAPTQPAEAADVAKDVSALRISASPSHASLGHLTIADFGSSHGRNSMPVLDQMIKLCRESPQERLRDLAKEVVICLEDQTSNDFSELFKVVHHENEHAVPHAKLHKDVFIVASGTSFAEQCLPSESVHFASSNFAFQWLSRLPGKLTGACHHLTAKSAEELEAFEKVAAIDWQNTLFARSKELAKGGVALFVTPCRTVAKPNHEMTLMSHDLVQALHQAKEFGESGYEPIVGAMYEAALQLQKAEPARVTDSTLAAFTLPIYFRTVHEMVGGHSGFALFGLELLSVHVQRLTNPIWTHYLALKDADKFAKEMTAWIRAWTNAAVCEAFGKDEGLASRYYSALAKLIAAKPAIAQHNTSVAYVMVRKI